MTGGGDRGVWARDMGFIGMGSRREEEKKQPHWARVGGAPSPQASPDQVSPRSPFSSDLQGPQFDGFGKVGLKKGRLMGHSLAMPFPACPHLGVLLSSLRNPRKGSWCYS